MLVEAFRELRRQSALESWELHLVGSVHTSGPHRHYFERVRRLAEGLPVHLHPDLPRERLRDLYRRASIYWHAAGFGADLEADPEAAEHFGMTTAEVCASYRTLWTCCRRSLKAATPNCFSINAT